jgi:hypothetical protein
MLVAWVGCFGDEFAEAHSFSGGSMSGFVIELDSQQTETQCQSLSDAETDGNYYDDDEKGEELQQREVLRGFRELGVVDKLALMSLENDPEYPVYLHALREKWGYIANSLVFLIKKRAEELAKARDEAAGELARTSAEAASTSADLRDDAASVKSEITVDEIAKEMDEILRSSLVSMCETAGKCCDTITGFGKFFRSDVAPSEAIGNASDAEKTNVVKEENFEKTNDGDTVAANGRNNAEILEKFVDAMDKLMKGTARRQDRQESIAAIFARYAEFGSSCASTDDVLANEAQGGSLASNDAGQKQEPITDVSAQDAEPDSSSKSIADGLTSESRGMPLASGGAGQKQESITDVSAQDAKSERSDASIDDVFDESESSDASIDDVFDGSESSGASIDDVLAGVLDDVDDVLTDKAQVMSLMSADVGPKQEPITAVSAQDAESKINGASIDALSGVDSENALLGASPSTKLTLVPADAAKSSEFGGSSVSADGATHGAVRENPQLTESPATQHTTDTGSESKHRNGDGYFPGTITVQDLLDAVKESSPEDAMFREGPGGNGEGMADSASDKSAPTPLAPGQSDHAQLELALSDPTQPATQTQTTQTKAPFTLVDHGQLMYFNGKEIVPIRRYAGWRLLDLKGNPLPEDGMLLYFDGQEMEPVCTEWNGLMKLNDLNLLNFAGYEGDPAIESIFAGGVASVAGGIASVQCNPQDPKSQEKLNATLMAAEMELHPLFVIAVKRVLGVEKEEEYLEKLAAYRNSKQITATGALDLTTVMAMRGELYHEIMTIVKEAETHVIQNYGPNPLFMKAMLMTVGATELNLEFVMKSMDYMKKQGLTQHPYLIPKPSDAMFDKNGEASDISMQVAAIVEEAKRYELNSDVMTEIGKIIGADYSGVTEKFVLKTMKYQERFGLKQTGFLDRPTIKSMVVALSSKVQSIVDVANSDTSTTLEPLQMAAVVRTIGASSISIDADFVLMLMVYQKSVTLNPTGRLDDATMAKTASLNPTGRLDNATMAKMAPELATNTDAIIAEAKSSAPQRKALKAVAAILLEYHQPGATLTASKTSKTTTDVVIDADFVTMLMDYQKGMNLTPTGIFDDATLDSMSDELYQKIIIDGGHEAAAKEFYGSTAKKNCHSLYNGIRRKYEVASRKVVNQNTKKAATTAPKPGTNTTNPPSNTATNTSSTVPPAAPAAPAAPSTAANTTATNATVLSEEPVATILRVLELDAGTAFTGYKGPYKGQALVPTVDFLKKALLFQIKARLGLGLDAEIGVDCLVLMNIFPGTTDYATYNVDNLEFQERDENFLAALEQEPGTLPQYGCGNCGPTCDTQAPRTKLTTKDKLTLRDVSDSGVEKRPGDVTGDDVITFGIRHFTDTEKFWDFMKFLEDNWESIDKSAFPSQQNPLHRYFKMNTAADLKNVLDLNKDPKLEGVAATNYEIFKETSKYGPKRKDNYMLVKMGLIPDPLGDASKNFRDRYFEFSRDPFVQHIQLLYATGFWKFRHWNGRDRFLNAVGNSNPKDFPGIDVALTNYRGNKTSTNKDAVFKTYIGPDAKNSGNAPRYREIARKARTMPGNTGQEKWDAAKGKSALQPREHTKRAIVAYEDYPTK